MVKWEKEKLNQAKVDMDGPQVGCDDPDPRSMKTASNLVKTKLRLMGLKPLMMSNEPEGEMVDEARAIGRTRSTDANPRGAAVRLSSGRGSTMTPARGLGASKPEGDDEERSSRQKEQAKKDRRAAAIDRAEEGEDRLSRLVRSVQNSSYEPEGEVLEDYVVVKKDGSRQIVKGDPPTPKVKPSPYNRALAKKQKKEASRNRDENPYIARPGESD